jgi:Uma2 family endonuclease
MTSQIASLDADSVAKWYLPESFYQQEDKFINLALDFIIEILSKNDKLPKFKANMKEYITNGV